uniref:Uncharacterized protein MANES_18G013800 n=1 Tax=Rhizophora mucronata TaxID=61149 RepID=A0A2P2L5L7_RHIMU
MAWNHRHCHNFPIVTHNHKCNIPISCISLCPNHPSPLLILSSCSSYTAGLAYAIQLSWEPILWFSCKYRSLVRAAAAVTAP